MNKKQLDSVETKARRVAQNSFDILTLENDKGRRTGYMLSVDGHTYGTLETFYEAFPECKPREQKRVYGPYRVKNIGVGGDVWEVVMMVDGQSNTWEELRPRVTYAGEEKRQTAYAKCLRLNKRWVEQALEAGDYDGIEYWEKATN